MKVFFLNGIEAKFIRLYPKSWVNNIALKLVVYGCNRPQPLIETTKAPKQIEDSQSVVSSYSSPSLFINTFGKKLTNQVNEIVRFVSDSYSAGNIDSSVADKFKAEYKQLIILSQQLQNYSPEEGVSINDLSNSVKQSVLILNNILDENSSNGKISPVVLATVNSQQYKINQLVSLLKKYDSDKTYQTTTTTNETTTFSETSSIKNIGTIINTGTQDLGKLITSEIINGNMDTEVANEFKSEYDKLIELSEQLENYIPGGGVSIDDISKYLKEQVEVVKKLINENKSNGKISPPVAEKLINQQSKIDDNISMLLQKPDTSTGQEKGGYGSVETNITTLSETSSFNSIGENINTDTQDFGKLITSNIMNGNMDTEVANEFKSEYDKLIELSEQLENYIPGGGISIDDISKYLKEQVEVVKKLINENKSNGKISPPVAEKLINQQSKIDDNISMLLQKPDTSTGQEKGGYGSVETNITTLSETSSFNSIGENINTDTQDFGKLITSNIMNGNMDTEVANEFKSEYDKLIELSEQLQNYVPGGGVSIDDISNYFKEQMLIIKKIIDDNNSNGKISTHVAESLINQQSKIDDNISKLIQEQETSETSETSKNESIDISIQDSTLTTTIGSDLKRDTKEFGRLISLGLLDGTLDADVAQEFKDELDKLLVLSQKLQDFSPGNGVTLHQISNNVREQVSFIKNIIIENISEGKIREGLKFTLIDQESKLDDIATILGNHALSAEGVVSNGEIFSTVSKDIVTINNMLSEIKEATITDTSKKDNLINMMSDLERTMRDLEEYKKEINEQGKLNELSIASIKAEIEKMKSMKNNLESTEFKEGLNKETITTINKIDVKSETVINSLISYVNKKEVHGK